MLLCASVVGMDVRDNERFVRVEERRPVCFPEEEWGSAVDYMIGQVNVYRDKETGEYVVEYWKNVQPVVVFDDSVSESFTKEGDAEVLAFRSDDPDVEDVDAVTVASLVAEYDGAEVQWGKRSEGRPSSYERVR